MCEGIGVGQYELILVLVIAHVIASRWILSQYELIFVWGSGSV